MVKTLRYNSELLYILTMRAIVTIVLTMQTVVFITLGMQIVHLCYCSLKCFFILACLSKQK